MTGTNVIVIPAKSQISQQAKRQLRVAAYCRVSTDDEEQLTSYEAQRTFYTNRGAEGPLCSHFSPAWVKAAATGPCSPTR